MPLNPSRSPFRVWYRSPGFLATVVGGGLALVGGCGPRGLPDTVAVQGRVTFAGGDCPHPGYVFFVPEPNQAGSAAAPRAASGRFERDGRFSVTTLRPEDGLVPGTYAVRVVCELPAEDDDSRGRSFVRPGFVAPALTVPPRATGPLTHDIDVPPASPATAQEKEAR